MRTALLPLATGALALSGCAAPATAPPPPPTPPASPSATTTDLGLAGYYEQRVQWAPCRDTLECGSIRVPLDYGAPDAGSITLSLLRVPAARADQRMGSLLVNPGGPGASGVDYAARADEVVSSAVRDVYDVVGVDPRGVGASTPVECVTDAELDASFSDGDATPDTPDEVEAYLASLQSFREGCLRRSAELLPHIGTADAARDLDIVRAALGDEVLSYLGRSYGSLLGAQYAEQFPTRVGRLVLDGVVDPTLTERDLLLGQAAGFEESLAAFAADCARRACRLGADPDEVLASVGDVLSRADVADLPTSSRPLSETLALYGIVAPLYVPADRGYPVLEEAVAEALDGDASVLLALADSYLGRGADGTFPTNQWDAFRPISCADRPTQVTVAEIEAALPEFRQASPRVGEALAWGMLACTDWPADTDGLAAPTRAAGAPPILVLGTTGDPATPYAWAQSLADQLESGLLLTYRARQHLSYGQGSACVDDAVDAYLLAGDLPTPGSSCD